MLRRFSTLSKNLAPRDRMYAKMIKKYDGVPHFTCYNISPSFISELKKDGYFVSLPKPLQHDFLEYKVSKIEEKDDDFAYIIYVGAGVASFPLVCLIAHIFGRL